MQTAHAAKPPRKLRRRFIIFGAVVLLATVYVATHRFAVYDYARLLRYQPSAAVVNLANDDKLTDYARHIYYVNHPQIQARTIFSGSCPSGTEQSVVLGCYHSNQNGIFLLDVSEPELQGIEQVTAAHESLHAAYDRLSVGKRKQIDTMLMDYYQHGLTDMQIKQTIDAYKQTEPTELVNEMHSIFGTEVASLPAPLEAYYRTYFRDRSVVTGYYAKYEQAFTSRQAEIKQTDRQLDALKTQIDAGNSDLQSRQATLTAQRNAAEADRQSGDQVAFRTAAANYNQSVSTYNAKVTQVRALIVRYNDLVATRNSIVLEERQLVQAISSTPSSAN